MDLLGITDPAIQEAVVELSRKQRMAIAPLKDQARHLARSLELKNSSDAQISALLADLQIALKAEKQRRALDLADFEVKFPPSQHSRLQTFMMFFNLLGEEAAVLDNIPQSLRRLNVKTVPQAAKQLVSDDEVFGKMVTMFVDQQEKAMRPLLARAKENRLSEMARPRLSEEESSAFLANFRLSVAQFEERRQNSLKILDAKTGYTRKPPLQATLFLLGITSNDIGLLNGFDIDGIIGFRRYTNVIMGADIEP